MPFSTGDGGQNFLANLTPSVLNACFVHIALTEPCFGNLNNFCYTLYRVIPSFNLKISHLTLRSNMYNK